SEIGNIDDPEVQDQLSPILDYAEIAKIVREGGYILPETPQPPPLTIIPGDRKVTITWSDVNVHTPDAYYYFLQEHPELDPEGKYREYDFEGYRLYRSFVGPSDSHSELIWESSLSDGNIAFSYIDRREDDIPHYRLNNGMKVWYALVPYDRNWDPGEKKWFSLPDPSSGKVWNRPGAQLYTVIPRSEASNFKPAELSAVTYIPPIGEALSVTTYELSGDGTGMITETPKFLEPIIDIEFEAVNSERITEDESGYLVVTDMGPHGGIAGSRTVEYQDASGNLIDPNPQKIMVQGRGSTWNKSPIFSGGMSDEGIAYQLTCTFQQNTVRQHHAQLDLGGYTGAEVGFVTPRCWGPVKEGLIYEAGRSNSALTRTGEFVITWKDAGGGNLTCEVYDKTRGVSLPFSKYIDDQNWGFIPPGVTYPDMLEDWGVVWGSPDNVKVPKEERSLALVETLPADNTEEFNLYLNGEAWNFSNITSMPSPGTVMTVIVAYGTWNDDKTVFTQIPDAIYLGDKWKIDIKAMSLDPEDADLSKIRVVPNPYMASSFLDLSPNSRRIEFVNLPDKCTIRIYSLGGHLVNVLNHIGSNRHGWGNYKDWDRLDAFGQPREFTGYDNHGGTEPWNLRNRFGQTVASGLYFFHVTDSRGKTYTGKFYIIN
ncbi:MAG: hypothetical protein DRG82_17160, partial [Deltaproteobacteria bacterium]